MGLTLIIASILLLGSFISIDAKVHRVAVIGSGVAGSGTAHFLRELLGDKVTIDVFEQDEKVGGRVQFVKVDDVLVEVGATIIHDANHYLKKFSDLTNVSRVSPPHYGRTMGLWDWQQKGIYYQDSKWKAISLAKLFWRYSFNLFKLRSYASDILERYFQFYSLQDQHIAFDTPEEMLSAVQLFNLTQSSLANVLLGDSPAPSSVFGDMRQLVNELVSAACRVNYNQSPYGLNALAGFVALMPSVRPQLFTASLGIATVVDRLLEHSAAKVHLNHRVSSISKNPQGSYSVASKSCQATSESVCDPVIHDYESVVVAAPLELAAIDLRIDSELPVKPKRTFRQTWATFVKGTLNPKYFGLTSLDELPGAILTSSETGADPDQETPFSSIGTIHLYPDASRLVKIFSRQQPSDELLASLFLNHTIVHQKRWLAYPTFSPPEKFAPFRLTPRSSVPGGVFYVNTIENSASVLEFSAIAARNVALLIAQDVLKPTTPPAPEERTKDEL